MSPKSGKKCAVYNCTDCEGKTVHTFPASNIEREKVWITRMLQTWIDFCNNPKITLENEKYKSSFIGETHFAKDCYPFSGPKKKLKKGSVPTLMPPLVLPPDPIIIDSPEPPLPKPSEHFRDDSPDKDLVNTANNLLLNDLNKLDYKNSQPIEIQLANITENAKKLQNEVNVFIDTPVEDKNKKNLLEQQLTKNIMAAQAIATTGYWQENQKCIVQTLQCSLRKLLLTKSQIVTQTLFFNVDEQVNMEIDDFADVNSFIDAEAKKQEIIQVNIYVFHVKIRFFS